MVYDIIGDIHGHADELSLLLAKLGYRYEGGKYFQPGHQAIFIGDFIDRGPKIRETLAIDRTMVMHGAARTVLGNHEYNAICYHTEDGKGDFLRSHTVGDGKNTKQHQQTIKQLAFPHPGEWRMYLDWFKGLPFFLELNGLRVVHASWDSEFAEFVRERSLNDTEFLHRSATKGSKEFEAIDKLLKGPEIPLPLTFSAPDSEGFERTEMRLAWWKPRSGGNRFRYDELAVPGEGNMPSDIIPVEDLKRWPGYANGEEPVIFGHYWLPADAPAPLSANAACVDFGVAKPGWRLVAYTWRGERTLTAEHFANVPRIG